MPRWLLKAAVQGTLSLFPDPQRWNRVLQTRVTKSLCLPDEKFVAKWRQAERHIEHWEAHAGEFAGTSVLEIGTGWLPIVPVALALSGAARVVSVDLTPLLAREQLLAVLERVERLQETGRLGFRAPGAGARLRAVRAAAPGLEVAEILRHLGIVSVIADARRLDLAPGSVDLFVSNNTFEHIPPDVLEGILESFKRLASPRALGSHHVDLADHYAEFDRTISVYNFLRFSDRSWRLLNNRLHYQNRLRASDYAALHHGAGWEIVAESPSRGAAAALESVPLAPRFRGYEVADLLVYETWLVSRPCRPEPSAAPDLLLAAHA